MKTIDGTDLSLNDYRGKVVLLVKAFCTTSYGVTFPLSSKIEVNGAGRAPLHGWLTGHATKPDGPGDITWNFAKFVVDRDEDPRS
jgi:glutathione peroxidase-family protein